MTWIYIVGPLAGAVLGGAIWAALMLREPPPRIPRSRRSGDPPSRDAAP